MLDLLYMCSKGLECCQPVLTICRTVVIATGFSFLVNKAMQDLLDMPKSRNQRSSFLKVVRCRLLLQACSATNAILIFVEKCYISENNTIVKMCSLLSEALFLLEKPALYGYPAP